MIVNTCGWTDGVGYELILSCVTAVDANVVLVVGDERLYHDLRESLQQAATADAPAPEIQYLHRSTGVKQVRSNACAGVARVHARTPR